MRRLGPTVLCVLAMACAHEPANGRVEVKKLTLVGNRNFSARILEEGLATEPPGWWSGPRYLDPSALDIDLERIPAFYAEHGWFDARVVRHEVRDLGNGAVEVIIQIDEGLPSRVDEIVIEGTESVEAPLRAQLVGDVPIELGRIFTYDDYVSAKSRVEQMLRDHGYAYAKVGGDVAVDKEAHLVSVHLKAAPGPLVHFAATHVEGNGDLPADAIAHRATWEPGERYHPYDLATTQARLYDLGLFSTVQLEIPPEPAAQADVTMNVTPGPRNELRLGGGVGIEAQREEARLRFEWARRSFLGGLRTLRLRLRPAWVVIPSVLDIQDQGLAAETDLTIVQPDFAGTRIATHGLIGYDRVIEQGYSYQGPRVSVGADRTFWHEHLLGGVSWNLQFLSFDGQFPGLGFVDPYRLAWLEEVAALDFRDRPIDPRAGANLTVRVEEGTTALGSRFNYLKVTPEVRAYVPVGSRVVLAARGMLGLLGSSGSEGSPVTRGYALGGPSSHRGFGLGRLAPQQMDSKGIYVPVPGDAALLISGEGRFDLMRLGQRWLGFVAFTDLGDATETVGQLDPARLHVAVGGSLEYDLPFGHIRAGVGVRLNRTSVMEDARTRNPDPDDLWAFHLSVGEAF